VCDLVRHHAREFALVLRGGDCARVDEDEAARQRKGVDVFGGDDVELVRKLEAGRAPREFRAEIADVIDDRAVVQDRHLLCDLLRGLPAHFDVLFGRVEIEAGFEVGRGPCARRGLRAAAETAQAAARQLRYERRN
jgi:hypothetical protein